MVSSSCIACLAHLAVLYDTIYQTVPAARGRCNLCDLALYRLGVLTSEFHPEEYTYLDFLLGVRPSSRSFLASVTYGMLGRILGRNPCRYSTSA